MKDNYIFLDVVEEIIGSIFLFVIDDYVLNILVYDIIEVFVKFEVIFDSGKSMSCFVIDLLMYLRDLFVV